MGLVLRFALVALFCTGVYALDQRYPEALERPEAIASLVLLGLILLASLFENGRRGERRRASDRRRGAPLVERGPSPTVPDPLAALHAADSRLLNGPSAEAFAPVEEPTRTRRGFIALRAAVVNLTAWFAVVALLIVAYGNRTQLRESALLALSALRPGAPIALSEDEAVLTRDGGGHFTTLVTINGETVRMLVDTGSSDVALPYEEAERLGVDLDRLRFSRAVMTANGQAMVAPVTLPEVTVGPITLEEVRASVAEPGRLGSALLGMSFLGQLREVAIRGDKLWLRE